MKRLRSLFSKTDHHHRHRRSHHTKSKTSVTETDFAATPMTDQKKPTVFNKLGQKLSSLKDDIADKVETIKHSQSNSSNSFIMRTNMESDTVVIEKKDPSPLLSATAATIVHQKNPDDDGSALSGTTGGPAHLAVADRQHSISSLAMVFGRGGVTTLSAAAAAATTSFIRSDSYRLLHDLLSTENSAQAKDMMVSSVRQEMFSRARATSETASEDHINRIDPREMTAKPTTVHVDKMTARKPTMLLSGPKFRNHTVEPENQLKRDTIMRISIIVGVISLIITLWKPISSFFSGFTIGFMFAAAICIILIEMYMNAKADESIVHEWIDFPELEQILSEKAAKEDKSTSLHTCGEIIFGRYDVDRDDQFVRYPCVIRLEQYRLILQLPTKAIAESEKKEKEIKFVGYREYLIKEANLILVPEATLTRIKYWLCEYPIVVQNLQILDKQIFSKQNLEKSKFDTDDFFDNPSTTLSIFFETGPEKEDWFHKLSLVIRKGKDEIERANRLLMGAPSAPGIQTSSSTDSVSVTIAEMPIPFAARSTETRTLLNERVQMKEMENVGPPYADTMNSDKVQTDLLREQITNEHIRNDIAQAKVQVEELRRENIEKDSKDSKKTKDSDKDATGTHRTASMKKKYKKQEETLELLLKSSDCLDEAAITMNFLARRLFCDIFEEPLFKDLLKEKVELKLKEIAIAVLDELKVEKIDLGHTFPVILKVEPMQWNTRGIWFNLFLFYRGSFKITIKTKLRLQKLLHYNPTHDDPMFQQHRSAQLVHKLEEKIDNDDVQAQQKLLAKEPEVPENVASRKLGTLLQKLATSKHFQRFAALKPVAGVIEKLSGTEVGVNVELTSFSGVMTINIPPPPSDRIWIGFPELPDLALKVTPVFGESKYSYNIIHDFLEARIKDEMKRLLVLPSMDDQLLPFFRDWVIDGEIASKPANPLTDNVKTSQNQSSFREHLIEYNSYKDLNQANGSNVTGIPFTSSEKISSSSPKKSHHSHKKSNEQNQENTTENMSEF
ncbi:unnamed protein product [Didymodactylos carnosus]|uniref:SMP-LTD domain-containing protein n=1 Tax=Didymodactylos carnosus TaxID=1234261 RepID=A0A8S2IVY0_9BILA|nr:unnamed protein product [Didymodactylos carnosus]CAF3783645.1 unnamed protein product [Didymodactylos carnosus]